MAACCFGRRHVWKLRHPGVKALRKSSSTVHRRRLLQLPPSPTMPLAIGISSNCEGVLVKSNRAVDCSLGLVTISFPCSEPFPMCESQIRALDLPPKKRSGSVLLNWVPFKSKEDVCEGIAPFPSTSRHREVCHSLQGEAFRGWTRLSKLDMISSSLSVQLCAVHCTTKPGCTVSTIRPTDLLHPRAN